MLRAVGTEPAGVGHGRRELDRREAAAERPEDDRVIKPEALGEASWHEIHPQDPMTRAPRADRDRREPASPCHREQRRERPDVDGQLGDLAVLAEVQNLDQLRVDRPAARLEWTTAVSPYAMTGANSMSSNSDTIAGPRRSTTSFRALR